MNKLKKLCLLAIAFIALSSCIKKEGPGEVSKPVKEVHKPKISQVDIKSYTFASSIILDDLVKKEDNNYILEIADDYSKLKDMDFDIAIIPAYRIVDLHKEREGEFKLAAISLLNNSKIVSDSQISDPLDLKDKNIMISDLGESMNKLISNKIGIAGKLLGLNLENYPDQESLVKNLETRDNYIALLSEPYYSKFSEKKDSYVFDINKSLSYLTRGEDESTSDSISDIIIVNKNYLIDNKEAFDKFLKSYKKSQEEISDNSTISKKVLDFYDITNSNAITIYKNLENTFIEGETMKGIFELYLDRLEKLDKSIFNSNRPSDDLYYIKD